MRTRPSLGRSVPQRVGGRGQRPRPPVRVAGRRGDRAVVAGPGAARRPARDGEGDGEDEKKESSWQELCAGSHPATSGRIDNYPSSSCHTPDRAEPTDPQRRRPRPRRGLRLRARSALRGVRGATVPTTRRCRTSTSPCAPRRRDRCGPAPASTWWSSTTSAGSTRPTWSRSRRSAARSRCPSALLAGLRGPSPAAPRCMSVCSGAFILGEAGLLDGRECTTHWTHVGELRRALPGGPGQRRRALRRQRDGVLTSAGTAAGIDASLYFDPPRVRHQRRQHAGPPDGDAAAPRGRPAAVRRPAGAVRGRHPLGHPAVDAGEPRRGHDRGPAGRPVPTSRRARSPAGSAPRPAPRRCSG